MNWENACIAIGIAMTIITLVSATATAMHNEDHQRDNHADSYTFAKISATIAIFFIALAAGLA